MGGPGRPALGWGKSAMALNGRRFANPGRGGPGFKGARVAEGPSDDRREERSVNRLLNAGSAPLSSEAIKGLT